MVLLEKEWVDISKLRVLRRGTFAVFHVDTFLSQKENHRSMFPVLNFFGNVGLIAKRQTFMQQFLQLYVPQKEEFLRVQRSTAARVAWV